MFYSLQELAIKYDVSRMTIRRVLIEGGIEIRSTPQSVKVRTKPSKVKPHLKTKLEKVKLPPKIKRKLERAYTREQIVDMWEQRRSTKEIAKKIRKSRLFVARAIARKLPDSKRVSKMVLSVLKASKGEQYAKVRGLVRFNQTKDNCDLCKRKARLYVDHCHKTGMVRGLVCCACNSGLGMFRDCIDTLRAASQYLEDHDIQAGLA